MAADINRSAEREAPAVITEGRFFAARGIGEELSRIQNVIAKDPIDVAVELAGAGYCDHVKLPALLN